LAQVPPPGNGIGDWISDVGNIFQQQPHPQLGQFTLLGSSQRVADPAEYSTARIALFQNEAGIKAELNVNDQFSQFGGDTMIYITLMGEDQSLINSTQYSQKISRELPREPGGLQRWRMELVKVMVGKVYEMIDDELEFSRSMGIRRLRFGDQE
jgi:hypothetical protein